VWGVPSISGNIEVKYGGVGVNAIGKGRVNCLEGSGGGSSKDGRCRNNC
jgi:hypothetical protein